MKMELHAIYDRAAHQFGAPYAAPTTEAAIRSFSNEVNRAGNDANINAEDFDLYLTAYYDTETGDYEDHDEKLPRLVARAVEVKNSHSLPADQVIANLQANIDTLKQFHIDTVQRMTKLHEANLAATIQAQKVKTEGRASAIAFINRWLHGDR